MNEFGESLLRINQYRPILLIASIGTVTIQWCKHMFGLTAQSILILALLLVIELASGIAASIKQGKSITSKRLQRFGIKVTIYFLIIAVFAAFTHQYKGNYMEHVYNAVHSFIILYIILVYLISILENASVLMGGSREIDSIIKFLRKKKKQTIDKKL